MFERILIANRGEIACRVMATAHRLGIATVAVYSDADAGAKHVALADAAVRIGPPPAAESYLRGDAIIAAALATGAEAIHPGYGFLSENPDFVDAVAAAGLTFIGPPASAIRAMGLKDAAKALMAEAGVPVVPGYHGARQDDGFLAEQAAEIGWPVLIKAVAGGGGKGMRRVDRAADFASALAAARGEARAAFGNADVLIEKYVTAPRHVEIQVFGDNHGQRRAPLRARLLAAAPPPEGDRGGPRPRHDRGGARGDGRGGGAGGEGDRLFRRRHGRVHRRRLARPPPRRLLVHGDEHPPAGGASGDRGDHRRGPGRVAAPRRRRRAAAEGAGRARHPRPRLRGAALRRGRRARLPARHRHADASRLPARRARQFGRARRRRHQPLVRPDDRQADRARADPRHRAQPARPGARRDPGRGLGDQSRLPRPPRPAAGLRRRPRRHRPDRARPRGADRARSRPRPRCWRWRRWRRRI